MNNKLIDLLKIGKKYRSINDTLYEKNSEKMIE